MSDRPTSRTFSRRVRFGVLSGTLLLAITASCVIAAVIAERRSWQFDATATREHSLSQRTRSLIQRLDQNCEIVVVTDDRTIDRRARQRVRDVLDAFDRASDRLSVTFVNPLTERGRERFLMLQERIALRYDAELTTVRETIQSVSDAGAHLVNELRALSDSLLSVRDDASIDPSLRQPLDEIAAFMRLRARSLEDVATRAGASAARPDAGAVELDEARAELAPELAAARDDLSTSAQALNTMLDHVESPDSPMADSLIELLQRSLAAQEEAARRFDALDRLGRSEASVVSRVLESGDAVLLISEGVSTAIPFNTLFPTRDVIDESGGNIADLRFIGEELIATALGSLSHPSTPIVALAHNLPGRLLTDTGEPASPSTRQAIGALLDRLHLRGMDVREWAVLSQPIRPDFARLDPSRERPVVWVCFGTEGATAEAASRFDRYAQAVASLVRDGERVLISHAPSVRPADGAADPLSEAIRPLGAAVDSGRPLVRRLALAQGDAFEIFFTLRAGAADHPIADAVRGLPTRLAWTTHIQPLDEPAPGFEPLLVIDDDANIWAEAEWRQHANAPDDRRWVSRTPPTPNERYDNIDGPWTVAAAIERRIDPARAAQRAVIVASPGWFFDRITQQSTTVEGRTVTRYPGNMELLEASVYWLAGQDEMIAPSPSVMQISRIRDLSDSQLSSLRWALVVGPAMLTLCTGAGWRLLRRI